MITPGMFYNRKDCTNMLRNLPSTLRPTRYIKVNLQYGLGIDKGMSAYGGQIKGKLIEFYDRSWQLQLICIFGGWGGTI